MARTTNRDSTSGKKDSMLMVRRIRPLLAVVANSNKLISEIAKPLAFLRAWLISVLAFPES
jgi:hypothetical protein